MVLGDKVWDFSRDVTFEVVPVSGGTRRRPSEIRVPVCVNYDPHVKGCRDTRQVMLRNVPTRGEVTGPFLRPMEGGWW